MPYWPFNTLGSLVKKNNHSHKVSTSKKKKSTKWPRTTEVISADKEEELREDKADQGAQGTEGTGDVSSSRPSTWALFTYLTKWNKTIILKGDFGIGDPEVTWGLLNAIILP